MIYSKGCVEAVTIGASNSTYQWDENECLNEQFWGGFFSLRWSDRLECSRDQFHAQFATYSQRDISYNDAGYEEWLDGLLAEDDVGGLGYAKYLHTFLIPPVIGLPGLRYIPLDPGCPDLVPLPDIGYELAAEWGDFDNQQMRRLDQLDELDLSGFVPKYKLPWHGEDSLTWDSHWGALYVHLIENWALTSALFGI